MAAIPVVAPSARLFIGPGDRLFGYDVVWVLILAGNRAVIGNHGDDRRDIDLLTHILSQNDKAYAYNQLIDILREGVQPGTWNYRRDDTPVHVALKGDTPLVWTVDFDQGYLFYDRDGEHRLYQFKLPEKQPLCMRHLQPYSPKKPPCKQSRWASTICSTRAAPRNVVPQQLVDLVYRLASGYERNWRSCGLTVERYGIHQLAMGLLSCFTLNFHVQKIDARVTHLPPYVERPQPGNLLRWRAWPSPQVVTTVSLGATQIIFAEDMSQATTLVHEHFASEVMCPDPRSMPFWGLDVRKSRQFDVQVHYIVTSIREIQYFKMTQYHVSSSPAIPFFDDCMPLSEKAVRWMLNAIHGHDYPIRSSLYSLPVELQEMILDYASEDETSLIGRAVYASLLGIGVPFRWTENNKPLISAELSSRRDLHTSSPEHQVFVWSNYVGMLYQRDGGDWDIWGNKWLSDITWKSREKMSARTKYYGVRFET